MIVVEWVQGFDWSALPLPEPNEQIRVNIRMARFGIEHMKQIPKHFWKDYRMELIDYSSHSSFNAVEDFANFVVLGRDRFNYRRKGSMFIASSVILTINKDVHYKTFATYGCVLNIHGKVTCQNLICRGSDISDFCKQILADSASLLNEIDIQWCKVETLIPLGRFLRLETIVQGFNSDYPFYANLQVLAYTFPRLSAGKYAGGWTRESDAHPLWLISKAAEFFYGRLAKMRLTTILCLKGFLKRDVARLIARKITFKDVPFNDLKHFLDVESCKLSGGVSKQEHDAIKEIRRVKGAIHNIEDKIEACMRQLGSAKSELEFQKKRLSQAEELKEELMKKLKK